MIWKMSNVNLLHRFSIAKDNFPSILYINQSTKSSLNYWKTTMISRCRINLTDHFRCKRISLLSNLIAAAFTVISNGNQILFKKSMVISVLPCYRLILLSWLGSSLSDAITYLVAISKNRIDNGKARSVMTSTVELLGLWPYPKYRILILHVMITRLIIYCNQFT